MNTSSQLDRDTPVKVVYVAGSGRCGTTLLDTILGNHPDIVGAGELTYLARSDWFQRMYCPCGRRTCDCPFWCATVDQWCRRSSMNDLSEYELLQNQFEGRNARRLVLWSRERRRTSAAFARYAQLTRSLFEALRSVSGKAIVVDSSVVPTRGFALARVPGIDLYVVHIVRDGRGVAWSLRKRLTADQRAGIGSTENSRPIWRSAISWSLRNAMSDRLRRSVARNRSHFCRYEDLVEHPGQFLTEIGKLIDCDLQPVITKILADEPLGVNCTFAGNRMRMGGPVKLRLDAEWRHGLSSGERKMFSLLGGWWLAKYGYFSQKEARRRAA